MSDDKAARRRGPKKTTKRAPAKKTVADEPIREQVPDPQPTEQPVADPAPAPVDDAGAVEAPPMESTERPAEPVVPVVTQKKECVGCGGRAVMETDFPWTPKQAFCARCCPRQYRYLLPS